MAAVRASDYGVITPSYLDAPSFADDRPGLLEASIAGFPIVVVWELDKRG